MIAIYLPRIVMPIVMTLFLSRHSTTTTITTITTTTTSTVDRLKPSTSDSTGIKSWTMGMTLLSQSFFHSNHCIYEKHLDYVVIIYEQHIW